VEVAKTDAEGFAGPSVRQRALAGAEEPLDGVLGDRGYETEGSFEKLAEVRGADYVGHHRCIVFRSGNSPAELGKRSVDADTTSWNWTHNGGNMVFGLPRWTDRHFSGMRDTAK
jgi:hypothetical protein